MLSCAAGRAGWPKAAGQTGADGLGQAIADYEVLEDLIGRIGSYAGLAYYSDTSDPKNGKFYGDTSARLTELASRLLFFGLELNRIETRRWPGSIARDKVAAPLRALDQGSADREALPGSRTASSSCSFEKAQTGAAAWNRLFDETMPA